MEEMSEFTKSLIIVLFLKNKILGNKRGFYCQERHLLEEMIVGVLIRLSGPHPCETTHYIVAPKLSDLIAGLYFISALDTISKRVAILLSLSWLGSEVWCDKFSINYSPQDWLREADGFEKDLSSNQYIHCLEKLAKGCWTNRYILLTKHSLWPLSVFQTLKVDACRSHLSSKYLVVFF